MIRDIPFDTSDLKRRSARGSVVLLGSQAVKFALQSLSVVALSRLLAPADFGLVAMVAPFAAFVAMFNDLGLSQATIQRREVTDEQLSALFWVAVGFSGVLVATVCLFAPLIGQFYGEPRTVMLLIAFAFPLLFSGLAAQHLALLNRSMRFQTLACVEIAALVTSIGAGITVAWLTRSYWSLVVPPAVGSITTAAMASSMSGWHPGRPRRGSDVRAMVRFGANLTGFSMMNFFARNLDNILIGRAWGPISLGFYDQAYKLFMLPLNQISYPISRIATPILSRLMPEPERYRRVYLQMIGQVMLFVVPGVVCLVVLADDIIPALLGPKWSNVVPIFQWLGLGGLASPIGQSTGWLFISQDRTGEMLRWGAVSSALFVASFLVGLPYGPVGVAAAYISVGYLVQGPLICWAVTRRGPVRLIDLVQTFIPFVAAAAVSGAAVYGVNTLTVGHPFASAAVCLPLSYTVSACTLGLFPNGRAMLVGAKKMIGSALARPDTPYAVSVHKR